MFTLLVRLFIPDYKNYSKPEVHRAYGTLCSAFAIALNIALVIAKLITASVSKSFSIRADAVNNLTDVGSSVLLLLAFFFAGMRPRPDRPFGHGRIEYVVGFVVAVLIIVCGIETGRDAIRHILHPSALAFSWLIVAVLVASIGVKFYMSFFMLSTSKKIGSEALHATSIDSMSDTISTFATLLGILLFHFTSNRLNLDGWLGLFVAIIILKAGVESAKGTLFQLLGTKPSPELIKRITDICMDHDAVMGIHDLVVHDYGPGRLHVSVHCVVPGDRYIFELHEAMDHIMLELDDAIGCESVIHMDPICTDDEHIAKMRDELQAAVQKLGPGVRIHDLRLVTGVNGSKAIFDCVIPYDVEPDKEKAEAAIQDIVTHLWENTLAVVKIDRPYV